MDAFISDRADQLLLLVVPTIHEFNAVKTVLKDLLSSEQIELAMSGMGMQAATVFCRMLEGRERLPSGMALLGWAGGLSPDLNAGDVIVASVAMNTSGGLHPCKVIPLSRATVGPVLTVPTFDTTPKEKNAHQDSGALAVEMEAYPLAAWADTRGLPFIHARVVLDAFDESLPDIGDTLDTFGRVHPVQLITRLLRRPYLIGRIFHLYRKVRMLAPSLGWLAGAVAQFWFDNFPMPDFEK